MEVGNGAIEEGHGVCRDLQIWVQEVQIIQNFFILELGRSEVVLGVDWLASLGPFKGRYQEMTIEWGKKGCHKVLRGDPSLCRTKSSWKTTLKVLRAVGEGYLVTPIHGEPAQETETELSPLPESCCPSLRTSSSCCRGCHQGGNMTMPLCTMEVQQFLTFGPTGTLTFKRMKLRRL